MILSYLKYILTSNNAHGIHSPFIYDLVTKVIYDKTEFSEYARIENLRQELKQDHRQLSFEDLGAGKRPIKETTVSKLVSQSGVSRKYGRLLFRLARWFQPQNALELGTSLGLGTAYLASGLGNDGHLYTIEGSSEISELASKNFQRLNLSGRISIETGNIEQVLPGVMQHLEHIDLIYFDANHRLPATLNYFNHCVGKTANHSLFIFDDINWSHEMQEAWQIIKSDQRISVSVDLYRMGLIFFRKDQAPEHFIIRF